MTSTTTTPTAVPTLEQVKQRQQQTWSSGDYARIAWLTSPLADVLCEAVDLRAGATVLDVASGTGNVALAAARRFATVTSSDYVPALLDVGRRRAEAEKLTITFREADAEALPFADDRFDYVLSAIGAMFTPDHARTARELVRVAKPGGVVGTLNWTPDGFVGGILKTVATYAPPPAGVEPPTRWGTVEHQHELFDDLVTDLTFTEGAVTQRFTSPEHFADFFVDHYGPTLKASESLDADRREAFRQDLAALGAQHNRADDGTLVCDWQYLVTTARKR
jgi:ubiquinone/menaquinone biosynthesis C-methylase UbiE